MMPKVEQRTVDGHLEMRVSGGWPLRHWTLRSESGVVASLGVRSWLALYFGRGQHVQLPDGAGGRIVGAGMRNWIIPLLVDDRGNTVARAIPGPHGSYTIDTIDQGFLLIPATSRTWRSKPRQWEMLSWDEVVARLTADPDTIDTLRPIPLAAVLLAFTVMNLGIPGEGGMGPQSAW